MTRVLVTGAAGFIGAHAVRALSSRGLDVVATDRPGVDRGRLGALGVPYEEADLAAPGAAASLVARARPDALLHLAWYARPEDYLVSRENLGSLAAATALFAAAVDSGVRRIVGAGTCIEYPPAERAHRESDAPGPDTLYGACKHAAHAVGARLAAGRASFVWARIFHLHGPGEDPRRLVPMVAGKLRRGEPVELSGGAQVRDYLRVEDVADALATLVLSGSEGPANVCSGRPVTLRALLSAVGEVLGRPDLLRFGALPYRPGDRMHVAGEPAALAALGWRPRHGDLAESLAYLAEAG